MMVEKYLEKVDGIVIGGGDDGSRSLNEGLEPHIKTLPKGAGGKQISQIEFKLIFTPQIHISLTLPR